MYRLAGVNIRDGVDSKKSTMLAAFDWASPQRGIGLAEAPGRAAGYLR
jgi:hypothetical protein